MSSLSLEQYNQACYYNLSQGWPLAIARDITVNQGSLILCPSSSQPEDSIEIAAMINPAIQHYDWAGAKGVKMVAGWTRYDSSAVSNSNIRCGWRLIYPESWISQANFILKALQVTTNYENYVVVDRASFELTISGTRQPPPQGYLFLCSVANLQCGPSSFRWPNFPASNTAGFPIIELRTWVTTRSWNANVYQGIRQFYEAKGFNPDTQDVARHLKHPLWELSVEVDVPLKNVDDECDSGQETSSYTVSGESDKEEYFDCDESKSKAEQTSDDGCPPESESNKRYGISSSEGSAGFLTASEMPSSWKTVELVKLALTLVLLLVSLLEYFC
ncbi:hypothetical protein B0H14DRAFT_2858357 [Mycena olivaceomarginata]|nr:hypothetical protein B0H14DRAFT_2858357 [Mycena olivaceomarginata]